MTDPILTELVSVLSSLPGVGKKSAMRIGFHFLRMEKTEFDSWVKSLVQIKTAAKFCSECGGISDAEICSICSNDHRSKNILCIVEQPEDVFFVENTGEFPGKYHVLGGAISPIDGIGPEKLRIRELLNRLKDSVLEEILIATNPTLEGDATASYISSLLKDSGIKVTRIAHGVTVGSTIEYADQYTLGKAIRSRLAI